MLTSSEIIGSTRNAYLIDVAVANYRKLLEKHFKKFDPSAVQTVLGQLELADEQFEIFRRRVKLFSNLIVRPVKVNRNRSPQESIAVCRVKQSVDRGIVNSIPKGNPPIDGDEVDVIFFKPEPWEHTHPDYIRYSEIEKARKRRNLVNDPMAAIAVNEDDNTFADEHPNGFLWMDSGGYWCRALFLSWNNESSVEVRLSDDWSVDWWIPGVPMPAKAVEGSVSKGKGLVTLGGFDPDEYDPYDRQNDPYP